jgi:hypothetical protein
MKSIQTSQSGDPSFGDFPDDGDLWEHFVANFWEKKPTVLSRPFGNSLVSDSQALSWISEAFSNRGSQLGKEFFIEGVKQDLPEAELLPRHDEFSIEAYTKRLAQEQKIKDYQFVLYGLGRFDPLTTVSTKKALQPLIEKIGLPAGTLDTDCFFGDYRETAAGLHKDNAAVFSYVVHGQKTMLVWPYEYFAHATDNPDAIRQKVRLSDIDFRQHLDAATALVGNPGDVLYWPSTYWHVSIGRGDPQMTFNISLYFPYRPRADVDEILNLLTKPKLDSLWERFYPTQGISPQDLAQQVPASWSKVVETYQEVLNSKKFQGMLLGAWMRRVSSGGFTTRPIPNLNWKISSRDLVRGHEQFPILTAPSEMGKVIVAAAGMIFLARHDGPIQTIINLASSGKAFCLEDLEGANSASSESWLNEGRELIEKLLKCWGLLRIEGLNTD